MVDGLDLCIEPETPLIWCLHIVVDHHMHAHLELVPPQQGPGTWPHIHWSYLHHTVFWVTGQERREERRKGVRECEIFMCAIIILILTLLSYLLKYSKLVHRCACVCMRARVCVCVNVVVCVHMGVYLYDYYLILFYTKMWQKEDFVVVSWILF